MDRLWEEKRCLVLDRWQCHFASEVRVVVRVLYFVEKVVDHQAAALVLAFPFVA